MIISKVWAMPNGDTFSIKPIKAFLERWLDGAETIVDPFAKDSLIGTIRNDLNPETAAQTHMDALAFLKTLADNSADAVLIDPPYSITQAAQLYKQYGKDKLEINVANMKYWAEIKNEAARICKRGGCVLCFGWNTNGLGKGRGFTMEEVLIVNHGGSKNDTLCSAERKEQMEGIAREMEEI